MTKPLIILVGADKGGVGKTTISRTIGDYLNYNQLRFKAFDTENPSGVLNRFFPANTEVLDLTKVPDQMKVFDNTSTSAITLIDIRAGLLSPTLKTLGDVGLLQMVKSGALGLAIFHILGPTTTSLAEVRAVGDVIPGAKHYLVKNHVSPDTAFLQWSDDYKGTATLDIPNLNDVASETVDNAGVPFTNFINNENQDGSPANNSMMLRGYVRNWLNQVYVAYDTIGLNTLSKESLVQKG